MKEVNLKETISAFETWIDDCLTFYDIRHLSTLLLMPHMAFLIFNYPLFLYDHAAKRFRAIAKTPRATKFRHNSINVVPFKYTERRISTK